MYDYVIWNETRSGLRTREQTFFFDNEAYIADFLQNWDFIMLTIWKTKYYYNRY